MVASDDITVKDGLLTRGGSLGWRTVVSNNVLPSSGVFQFEIELVKIGEVKSNYGGFMFGISSSLHPITDGKNWDLSAIMFCTYTYWRGYIFQPNNSNTAQENKYNFLSM